MRTIQSIIGAAAVVAVTALLLLVSQNKQHSVSLSSSKMTSLSRQHPNRTITSSSSRENPSTTTSFRPDDKEEVLSSSQKSSSSEPKVQHHHQNTPSSPCDDNIRCPVKDGCIQDIEGICYKAPFDGVGFSSVVSTYNLPKNTRGGGGANAKEELTCSWMPETPSPRPPLSTTSSSSTTTPLSSAARDNNNDEPMRRIIQNFKHLTGMPHPKWYDWEAPIVRISSSSAITGRDTITGSEETTTSSPTAADAKEEVATETNNRNNRFVMSSGHEGPDMIYKVRNFCMKPGSKSLFGYRPKPSSPPLGEYRGGHDMLYLSKLKAYQGQLQKINFFLKHGVEELKEEPKWYVDRKLVLVPANHLGHKYYPAHNFIIAASTIHTVEKGFPTREKKTGQNGGKEEEDTARDDVTLVHISTEYDVALERDRFGITNVQKCGDSCSYKDYESYRYSTLSTRSQFSVFNSLEYATRAYQHAAAAASSSSSDDKSSSSDGEHLQQLINETMVCFKEAVVWQACYMEDCLAGPPELQQQQQKSNEGGKKSTSNSSSTEDAPSESRQYRKESFPMWGWQNPVTQRRVARRFKKCVGLEKTKDRVERDVNSPLALFAYRSRNKNFVNYKHLIPLAFRWLREEAPMARMAVVEAKDLDTKQSVVLYSQVDIIFGIYSSAFIWSFLCPPGSIGVEVGWPEAAPRLLEGDGGVMLNRLVTTDYGTMYSALPAGRHYYAGLSTAMARVPHLAVEAPNTLLRKILQNAVKMYQENTENLFKSAKQQPRATTPPADDSGGEPDLLSELQTAKNKELLDDQRSQYEMSLSDVQDLEYEWFTGEEGPNIGRTTTGAAEAISSLTSAGALLRASIHQTVPRKHFGLVPGLMRLVAADSGSNFSSGNLQSLFSAVRLGSHAKVKKKGGEEEKGREPKRVLLFLNCALTLARSSDGGENNEEGRFSPRIAVQYWLQTLRTLVSKTVSIYLFLESSTSCSSSVPADLQQPHQQVDSESSSRADDERLSRLITMLSDTVGKVYGSGYEHDWRSGDGTVFFCGTAASKQSDWKKIDLLHTLAVRTGKLKGRGPKPSHPCSGKVDLVIAEASRYSFTQPKKGPINSQVGGGEQHDSTYGGEDESSSSFPPLFLGMQSDRKQRIFLQG